MKMGSSEGGPTKEGKTLQRKARKKEGRVNFTSAPILSKDAVVYLLSVSHYRVEGITGTSRGLIQTSKFAFNTGEGMIIIRRSAFPEA